MLSVVQSFLHLCFSLILSYWPTLLVIYFHFDHPCFMRLLLFSFKLVHGGFFMAQIRFGWRSLLGWILTINSSINCWKSRTSYASNVSGWNFSFADISAEHSKPLKDTLCLSMMGLIFVSKSLSFSELIAFGNFITNFKPNLQFNFRLKPSPLTFYFF